jgi:esterase/lipase superfamily enzyme
MLDGVSNLNHYAIYATAQKDKIVFTYSRYHRHNSKIKNCNSYSSLDELIEAIMDQNPIYRGILFYIHGFMADTPIFEEYVTTIMQNEVFDMIRDKYDLVISLKWTSSPNYTASLAIAHDKGRLFHNQIDTLISKVICNNNDLKLSFLNHSMGNRIFASIMDVYLGSRSRYRFDTVLMFAPDLENDVFNNRLALLPNRCRKIIVFYNQNDKTLKAANIWKAYPRLGIYGLCTIRPLSSTNILQVDVSNLNDQIGIVPRINQHRYFYASPSIRSRTISELLNTNNP